LLMQHLTQETVDYQIELKIKKFNKMFDKYFYLCNNILVSKKIAFRNEIKHMKKFNETITCQEHRNIICDEFTSPAKQDLVNYCDECQYLTNLN